MSNFSFLNEKYPNLARLGELAEKYLYYDSNTTFIKLGLLCENITETVLKIEGLYDNKSEKLTHFKRIKYLGSHGVYKDPIYSMIHNVRDRRNKASHEAYENINEAKSILETTYKIALWFAKVYIDENIKENKFVKPKKEEQISREELEKLDKKYTEEIKEYKKALEEMKYFNEAINRDRWEKERKDRQIKNERAIAKLELSKAETRLLVEKQLKDNGWEIAPYSKGARPRMYRCLAISKWPLKSGNVDYALFCGENLVGFVEIKKYASNISKNISKLKDYTSQLKEEHMKYSVGYWDRFKVPFVFVANGREYIDDFKEKSGVHLLDCREESTEEKILHNWYTPENIMEILEKDIKKSNRTLDKLSFDLLKDEDGVALRYYQVEAIKAIESAIKNKSTRVLITMATGTGKTRTILGLIYRLLVAKRFKRILFLVDRTSLAEQALETFEEVKIKDFLTLNQIYNINGLDEKNIEKETKIHISTIQSMVRRVIYSEDDEMPGVGDYDLIIVDEVHRGYILDRDIDEEELLYKDYYDFISKYKKVIDYFDAVKIGLTATPALHTVEIFGAPVYRYTYRQAVIDGYLVDHEPPHIINTKLSREGIHIKKGQLLSVEGEAKLLNMEILEDDLNFDIDDFNKKIIVESHTREALKEVSKYIALDEEGKTLIFAANDQHADMIVRILNEIYLQKNGSIEQDSIVKITAKTSDVELVIKQFKNDKYPKIAVTVDLLTTGIDVPKIDKLVFLRRVKSRILYEQMLGRATRLCDDIGKTHFEIYDCVNLYETLQEVSDMKPVVVDSKESFTKLHHQLEAVSKLEIKREILNKIIVKLQRKKKLLKNDILFETLSGKNIEQYIDYLKKGNIDEIVEYVIQNIQLIEYLDKKKDKQKKIIIADVEDEVVEHIRGYGKNKKPEDYISEFENYIKDNMNKIAALHILCNRPKDMTRNDLKAIRTILDGEGFSEEYLRTAYRDMTNQEITADIVAFIRQKALGSALISKEDRVQKAMEKIRAEFEFNKTQLNYLKKIEKYMLKEVIIDRDVFEMGNFKRDGGFKRYNIIFENNLEEIIQKIKEYMFKEDKLA